MNPCTTSDREGGLCRLVILEKSEHKTECPLFCRLSSLVPCNLGPTPQINSLHNLTKSTLEGYFTDLLVCHQLKDAVVGVQLGLQELLLTQCTPYDLCYPFLGPLERLHFIDPCTTNDIAITIYYKIQKHFQNVMLVGMASEISKNYTYKCVDRSRHNGIKGAKAKCAH